MLLTQRTTLFLLEVQFWHAKNLKSGKFNDKKEIYKQKCFFLYKNLKWESLTKNLVTFNFNIMGFTEKSDFFRGKGVNKSKGGVVGQFSDLRRGRRPRKERGCFFPHFGKHGVCHDITKSADSQTNKCFSDNDCVTAEFYRNVYQTNNSRLRILRNKKTLEKNSNCVKTDASDQLPF